MGFSDWIFKGKRAKTKTGHTVIKEKPLFEKSGS